MGRGRDSPRRIQGGTARATRTATGGTTERARSATARNRRTPPTTRARRTTAGRSRRGARSNRATGSMTIATVGRMTVSSARWGPSASAAPVVGDTPPARPTVPGRTAAFRRSCAHRATSRCVCRSPVRSATALASPIAVGVSARPITASACRGRPGGVRSRTAARGRKPAPLTVRGVRARTYAPVPGTPVAPASGASISATTRTTAARAATDADSVRLARAATAGGSSSPFLPREWRGAGACVRRHRDSRAASRSGPRPRRTSRNRQPHAARRRTAGPPSSRCPSPGAGYGIRTRDFQLGKLALYH